jgi:hypothetical protein
MWKNLPPHPHVLTFLGVDLHAFPTEMCMVSEWMSRGTIIDLLNRERHPFFSTENYVRRARQ